MAKWTRRFTLVWILLVVALYIPTNGLTSLINRTNTAVTLAGLQALELAHIGVLLRELPLALLGVTVLTTVFILIGVGTLRLLPPIDDAIACLITALALGQWIAALGLYALALVGQFRPLPVALLLFGLAGVSVALNWSGLRNLLRDVPSGFRGLIPKTNPWRLLFVLGAVMFLVSGLTAWAQMSNDGATAYFLTARLTAISHELRPVTQNIFHLSSMHTELQYAAGTLLFNHRAGRLVAWVYLLATVVMALPLGRVLSLDKRESTVFAFMVGSSTAMLDLAGDGKIDLTGIAVSMVAVYWLLVAITREEPNRRLIALTGLLLGIAVINKPTYIPFLGVITLAALAWAFRGEWDRLARYGLPLVVGGMLPVVLYLGGKWLVTGEPFAPAFYFTPPPQPGDINRSVTWATTPETIRSVRLLFPLVYTFVPTHLNLGTLSPLWLAFLPLMFSRRHIHSFPAVYRWVTLGAIATFLVWLFATFAVEELRYFYIVWVLVFALTARVIVYNARRPEFKTTISLLLIGLPLLLTGRALLLTAGMMDTAPDAMAIRCRTQIGCDANRLANNIAPEGTRVLQIQEFGHYMRRDLIACMPTMEEHTTLTRAALAGNFWQAAYDLGFTMINYDEVVSVRNWHFITPDLGEVPDGLTVTLLMEPTAFETGLYQITADPSMPPPSRACQQTPTGWDVLPTP